MSDWDEAWRPGTEQPESARSEADALRAKLAAEKARADAAEATKAWVISRITEELRREGIELQWTDGGGSACPGGWHRNPFLNLGRLDLTRRALELTARELAELRATGDAMAAALADLRQYEHQRHPPKMGGDHFPASLRKLMAETDAALAAWGAA